MRDLVVDALATHRLTRLVTSDRITLPSRAKVIREGYARRGFVTAGVKDAEWERMAIVDGEEAPERAQFIRCSWCVGMWVAFGVTAARRIAPSLWDPLARALAASSVAGILAGHESSG